MVDLGVSTVAGVVAIASLAAVIGGLAVGLVLALRERGHRRRVHQLFDRLIELENLLSREDGFHEAPEQSEGDLVRSRAGASAPIGVRGRFSTMISSLRRRSQLASEEPSRIDVRAVQHLLEHLDSRVTPSELASGLHVSLRTLQRQIHASLGCNPRDLIVAVKMHEAKRMLADSDRLVATVARAVGFEDPSYFSKKFFAYYGMSPSELSEAP